MTAAAPEELNELEPFDFVGALYVSGAIGLIGLATVFAIFGMIAFAGGCP